MAVLLLNQTPFATLHFWLCYVLYPLKDLQVNSKVEVSVKTDGINRWYDGTVEEVKYEDGKRLLKVRPLALQKSFGRNPQDKTPPGIVA